MAGYRIKAGRRQKGVEREDCSHQNPFFSQFLDKPPPVCMRCSVGSELRPIFGMSKYAFLAKSSGELR